MPWVNYTTPRTGVTWAGAFISPGRNDTIGIWIVDKKRSFANSETPRKFENYIFNICLWLNNPRHVGGYLFLDLLRLKNLKSQKRNGGIREAKAA